ncbi:MAG: 50S ribosomal protein L1, partial [Planctomycetota bacterium]
EQSVDLVLNLGIDPNQADQMIRGSVSLPHGVGKSKRVIAFCPEGDVEAAKAAGAIEAGGDELVKKVADGWLDFDVAVAHPSMMGKVGKLGRVLGPQGKMPSPKSGTVTPDVATAVKEYSAGKLEFRNDKGGNVHAVVGRLNFDDDKLKENVVAFVEHIRKLKPAAAKGQYLKSVHLSGSMTPSVPVAVSASGGVE